MPPQSLFICLERMSIPYDIPGFGRHCFSAYYLRIFHLTWYKKKPNFHIGLFNMNKTHGNRWYDNYPDLSIRIEKIKN